jgi:hypothetical protein
VFEESKKCIEKHGLDYGPYEEWSGCPTCGGAYTEARMCDCCQRYIDDNYIMTEDGKRYCSNCIRHMELGDEE